MYLKKLNGFVSMQKSKHAANKNKYKFLMTVWYGHFYP